MAARSGPELSGAGACVKPEEVVEAILWPRLKVKEGYDAVNVATLDGKVRQAYKDHETADEVVLRDPASREVVRLPRAQVEAIQPVGTLMPEGLAASMTPIERRDLVRFLIDLGRPGNVPPRFPPPDGPRPGRVRLRPRPARPRPQPRLATSRQPRPRLRLLRQGGRPLRQDGRGPPAPAPVPRPRRRQARPLGEPERGHLGRRPLEQDRPRQPALRRLPGGPA